MSDSEVPEKKKRKPSPHYGGRATDENNEPGHLAEQFLLHNYTSHDEKRLIHCFNNQFYKYTGTHYTPIAEEILKDSLYKFVRDNATQKRTLGLLHTTWNFLRAEIRLAEEREYNTWLNQPPRAQEKVSYVALQNGILDLNAPAAGLRPHSPEWFSLTCLPFRYQPEAGCENWLVFLESVFGNDHERIALLQEWFGYCLTPDTSLNKLMLFEGPTRAGKGVATDVLVRILGEENVSDIRLEMFDNRFQLSETVGKLLNVCDETDQMERVAEAKLKAFTGSTSKFYFDVKGQKGIHTAVTARVLILSNNGLPIYDRSTALVKRILHLQFEKSFAGKEDRTLKPRLFREIDGIFNWALEGYARIHAKGDPDFTLPRRSAEELAHYEAQSNPFKIWFDDHIERTNDPNDALFKAEEVLTRHNLWLKERGHRPIADNTCARQLRLLCPGIKDVKLPRFDDEGTKHRAYAWVGLRWKTD